MQAIIQTLSVFAIALLAFNAWTQAKAGTMAFRHLRRPDADCIFCQAPAPFIAHATILLNVIVVEACLVTVGTIIVLKWGLA